MHHKKFHLRRDIGLLQAVLYGVGVIVGAGIYALIGAGAGIAGNALWASFLIGAIIAAFTGFSYAELSSMYPKEAAEYIYTKHAFKNQLLSFIVEYTMFAALIVSAATVSLGFAGYLSSLIGGNITLIAALLVVVLSLINYHGMKDSSRFNIISTVISILGLLLIIIAWIYNSKNNPVGITDFFIAKNGIMGVLHATVLMFFAFLGFENLANFSEETKHARTIIPKALLISVLITAILYVLVSLSAVGILGADRLSASNAPLADAIGEVIPNANYLLSLIAIFATSSTVLIMLIVGSRLVYGLACNHLLPKVCLIIDKYGTPGHSVFIVMAFVLLSLIFGKIESVALLTTAGIFIVFLFVNASVIVLRYREPETRRFYRAPFNIGRFPVTAFLGGATSLGMLFFFDLKTISLEIGIILFGIIVYSIFNWKRFRKKL